MTSPATSPSSPRRADLLTPEELAALGGLELLAHAVVEGFLMGLHRSPHRGFSAEFAELRSYRPGDEMRHIDWRMFARSDRFYVKQFEEETNLRAYLLLDVSQSMDWSSRPEQLPTKLWYGQLLTAAMALLLLRQGDRAGLGIFDDRIREWLPDRGGRRQRGEVLRRLGEVRAHGATDASEALKTSALRLRRKGLVVLVSDLLMEPEPAIRALRFLRHRGHKVMVMHLLDPGERELEGTGSVRFRDPESGDELRVDVTEMRRDYHAAVERAVEEWRGSLRPHGIDYHLLDTSLPFARALRLVLGKRARLG
jgi:uncharacterized protein (DUF58 family)